MASTKSVKTTKSGAGGPRKTGSRARPGFRTYRKKSRAGRKVLLAFLVFVLVLAGAVYGLVGLFSEPPDSVQRAVYPLRYEGMIREAAEAYGVEPTLVAAVIYTESRYEPGAVSHQDARGLMQITPDTARFIRQNSGITGPYTDPEVNIWMGTWQLSYLEGRYLGDERATLAAYNSGAGNVDGWLSDAEFDIRRDIPFTETRNYVDKVRETEKTYRELYGRDLNRNP